MTMMPSLKLAKIVNKKEQYGRTHFKLALKNQNEKSCKTTTRKLHSYCFEKRKTENTILHVIMLYHV
jgi:hypothetical protein